MAERLHTLLHDEAAGLDVPPPDPAAIVGRGRRLRRRRQAVTGAVGLATVAVVGGLTVAVAGGTGDGSAPDPAATAGSAPVFSVGSRVFFDGAERHATIDDDAVKSLFYTSAGVLVRHGDNAWSDGGGPQRFSLVRSDGTVTRLGLVTEETVHASDPDQPYVAYAEAVDGELEAVVYDVAADREAARVPVGPTEEGWFPVSLDGGALYVQDGYEGAVYAVDWRSGEAEESRTLTSAWDVAEGRAPTESDGGAAVIDVSTGEELLAVDGGSLDLSPDGRFARLVVDDAGSGPGPVDTVVYDVTTGDAVTIPSEAGGAGWAWGWTPEGDLIRVGDGTVATCDATTGDCVEDRYSAPPTATGDPTPTCYRAPGPDGGSVRVCEAPAADEGQEVRVGGTLYES